MDTDKSIRIKDIARLAGVSVGTVDRVIHQRGNVADDVKRKIEQIISETGYQPNLLARTLGSNKVLNIAVVIPDPDQDQYWNLANTGVLQAVTEWSQYKIKVTSAYFDLFDSQSFSSICQRLMDSKPDAVLVAPIFHRESIELLDQLTSSEIPYVLFNTNIPEADPPCFIGQDLHQSGQLAGELLDLGDSEKRKIIVLHVHEDVENSVHLKQKENGLTEYFQKNSNRSFEITSLSLSNTSESGSEKPLLDLILNEDISGIFVTTSSGTHLAAKLIGSHKNHHLRLVGYDLLEQNIDYLRNGKVDFLINQNPKRQANLGISYLVNHLLFEKPLPKEDLFPLEVITRQNLESYLTSRIH